MKTFAVLYESSKKTYLRRPDLWEDYDFSYSEQKHFLDQSQRTRRENLKNSLRCLFYTIPPNKNSNLFDSIPIFRSQSHHGFLLS